MSGEKKVIFELDGEVLAEVVTTEHPGLAAAWERLYRAEHAMHEADGYSTPQPELMKMDDELEAAKAAVRALGGKP